MTMTLDDFWLGEGNSDNKEDDEKQEPSLYSIHQLAVNKNRVPTPKEYRRISELSMLRDISCCPMGAIYSNEIQKMRVPKKAFFWYLRSKLWDVNKITNVANKKDHEREIAILALMIFFEWNRNVAAMHYDLGFVPESELQRAINGAKPVLEKYYGI